MKSMAELAEEIAGKFGDEAMRHGLQVVGKYARDDGHAARILAFALSTGNQVAEWNRKEPALYDCPKCLDKAVVTVFKVRPDGSRIEGVYPCQECDAGLTDEAAFWKGQTKHYGWSRFNRFFGSAGARREMVLAKIRELENKSE